MKQSDRHCDSRVGFGVRFGAGRQFYLFQQYSFEVFVPRHRLLLCLIMPKLMDYSHFETGSYLINGCSRLRIWDQPQKYLYPNPNRKLRKRVLLVVLAVLFDSQLDYSDQFWIHFGQEVNDLFEKDSCTRPKLNVQWVVPNFFMGSAISELHRCWWSMLETVDVADHFEMLVSDLRLSST